MNSICIVCGSKKCSEVGLLYGNDGLVSRKFPLCKLHGTELFKVGQKKFLEKHPDINLAGNEVIKATIEFEKLA